MHTSIARVPALFWVHYYFYTYVQILHKSHLYGGAVVIVIVNETSADFSKRPYYTKMISLVFSFTVDK